MASFAITCLAIVGLAAPANAQTANTRYGYNALNDVTTGDFNSAFGDSALQLDQTGSRNTGVGFSALLANKAGDSNTATGVAALYFNSGSYNTAVGDSCLFGIGSGYSNTAIGYQALYSLQNGSNLSPSHNTASGAEALYNNAGDYNTAAGSRALYANSTGTGNTASGYTTLYNNTGGSYNTALGIGALTYNTTGSNNVAIGRDAGANLTTGSNNISIGASVLGKNGEANTTRIGKQGTQAATYIAGITGKTVASASAVAVFIDNTGKLGTVKSSARFKDEIKPMEKASEAILQLKPVSFRYKKELDPDGVRQFGLIAEQVEKVDPELVIRDEDGKVSTVRYEAVNAMLLNEFLREHRKVEEQDARLARQDSTIARQQKQIEALTAVVQKVSDKVELQAAEHRSIADQ